MIIRAEYDSGAGYVDISEYIEEISIQNQMDINKLHTPSFNGQSFKLRKASALDLEKGQHLRVFKMVTSSARKYLFSGYINSMKTKLRSGEITIDVANEVEYLKTQPIPFDPPGITHHERLLNSIPAGYGIGFLDGTAANKASENAVWAIRPTYSGEVGFYADLLHDHMLMMNYLFETDRFFFHIMNKSIFLGSNQDTVILNGDLLIDIETDSALEEIEFLYYLDVNEELRGDGLISGPLPPSGTFYKRENVIETAEELQLLNNVTYDSVDYGVITGISDGGNIKKYTSTVIEFVAS